ncbi:MAG: threonine--tRNA ligase, partial [Clostridia bacterium]|nr:threonine--tRNA ligase [Clostridia bacterium]
MKIKILDQVREYDAPVTVYDAAKDMELITRAVIGAEIDGKTVALTQELTADTEVKLLTFEDAAGKHLFRHT